MNLLSHSWSLSGHQLVGICVRPSALKLLAAPKLRNLATRRHRWRTKDVLIPRASTAGAAGLPVDPSSSTPSEVHVRPEDPAVPPVPEAQLRSYHYLTFFVLGTAAVLFIAALIYLNSGGVISISEAAWKAHNRLTATVAIGQLASILTAMGFVKYGLEPLIKFIRASSSKTTTPWEKSSEYYILREVYKPLEFLFLVAACTTLAENLVPQLMNVPKGFVKNVVSVTLSLTFVFAATQVVFNIKSRIVRESSWQFELKGDITRQRRLEAIDKLISLVILIVASMFAIKAFGSNVKSVLAIGGFGGVAVGLAGREILENLFTGLIILTSNPFEVGEEVSFRPSSGQVVEGIVVDVGWYRTTIRSFEREIYVIPNSVFSRNVVLNITRKNKEWRFFEFISLRLEDLSRVSAVVADIRKILRQDSRIIQKLHRRVFLDKITREDCSIYISFYVEAANRDAFMAVKQDLYLAFIDCVERNGASLARNKLQLEMLPTLTLSSAGPVVEVTALPQPVDVSPTPPPPPPTPAQPATGTSSSSSSGESSDGNGSSAKAAPKDGGNGGNGSGGASSSNPTSNIVATGSATSSAAAVSSSGGAAKTSSSSKERSTTAAPSTAASSTTSNTSTSTNPSTTKVSAQSVISAMANNPSAASKLPGVGTTGSGVVAPDAILRGIQGGTSVLASFDDNN